MMAYMQTSPKMEAFYEDYVAYLREEKHCSPNTLSAYQRDMQKFFDYAEEFGIASFDGVEASDVSVQAVPAAQGAVRQLGEPFAVRSARTVPVLDFGRRGGA